MPTVYSYMPTVYRTAPGLDDEKDILISFDLGSLTSGTEDFQVEATMGPTGVFPGMFDDTELDTTTAVECRSSSNFYVDLNVDTIVNSANTTLNDLTTDFYVGFLIENVEDSEVFFRSPYFLFSFTEDTVSEFKIYSPVTTDIDINNDLYISTSKAFYAGLDLYSTVSGVMSYLGLEAATGSGIVEYHITDIYSTYLEEVYLDGDIYSTASGTSSYVLEAAVASGTVTYMSSEMSSVVSGTADEINCDLRTWSLGLDSFFLSEGEYTTASSVAWVDITDPLIGVSVSGSYFKVDGQPKYNVTFSGIVDGYRMYYDPIDDFDTTTDTLVYTVHAENLLGDYLETSFNLVRGYHVEYNNPVVDWGPNTEVDIWMRASNTSFCPQADTDAFYFITRELEALNLGATIRPVEYLDFGAKLYPVNDFFFYGRTYTVTVSGVKDFAGNEMDPLVYSFTIEDPTS